MIGTLYALCAYLFNCEIVQESGGALADFAYYEKVWQWRCPAGAGEGVFTRPDGRERVSAMKMAGAMHPPFSLFLSAEKEKTLQRAFSPLCGSPWRAVHGPKEKRALLVLAQVHSVPRSDWRKLDAWTQGLFHWSRASHYPVPFGKDSSSTGGRTAVLPTRTQPGAKRGKRRKSMRQRTKAPSEVPADAAERPRAVHCQTQPAEGCQGFTGTGSGQPPSPPGGRRTLLPPCGWISPLPNLRRETFPFR